MRLKGIAIFELRISDENIGFRENSNLQATRISNTMELLSSRARHRENIKQLKSDLKKSTAFVKKLRVVSPDGLIGCIRDTETLNLTLYISEIVMAILETNYKATDVPSIVRLCGCLHRRYEDFTPPLITGLNESLMSGDSAGDKDDSKKKRIQLRLAIELFQDGILTDEPFLVKLLRKITCKSKGSPSPNQAVDLVGLTSFVKYGTESVFGYTPKRIISLCQEAHRDISDFPLSSFTSPSVRNELKMIIHEVYEQLCQDLTEAHKDLMSKERRFEKDRVLHGSLSEAKQAELDTARRLFDKLMSAATSLSESTGDPLPRLQVEKVAADSSKGISVWEGGGAGTDGGLYDDAETRSFYEDLPDLLSMVPLSALGLTPEQAATMKENWNTEEDPKVPDEDDVVNEEMLNSTEESLEESEKNEGNDKVNDIEDTPQLRVSALLEEKLPEVATKQKAVDFCVSFCYLNSKSARRKLVAALLKVNRNRPELVPPYARIVASLNRVFPQDIAQPVLEELQRTFYGNFKAKTQFYLENKIKTVRFLGELVKFKVAPPIVAFRMMKLLISEMTRHNVELLTVLIETCGRYLYLLPATAEKMNDMLTTILRLRTINNLDLHQQSMIEAAYFSVKPPERVVRPKKELTPMQKYVRYLLTEKLESCIKSDGKTNKESVDALIKSFRRLPWSDADFEKDVVKATLKAARKKYVNIPILADCVSGLSTFRRNFLCRLIDTLLEEIQHDVETPHKRVHQRAIGLTKLLGDLYVYQAVSSSLLFELLYFLTRYVRPNALDSESGLLLQSKLKDNNDDEYSDYFRIQLITQLLAATGHYFTTGQARDRLNNFLAVFQRFLLSKPGLPVHVEFNVLDLFDLLEDAALKAGITLLRYLSILTASCFSFEEGEEASSHEERARTDEQN